MCLPLLHSCGRIESFDSRQTEWQLSHFRPNDLGSNLRLTSSPPFPIRFDLKVSANGCLTP